MACLFLLQLMDMSDISDDDKSQLRELYAYGRGAMASCAENKDTNNVLLSAYSLSLFISWWYMYTHRLHRVSTHETSCRDLRSLLQTI